MSALPQDKQQVFEEADRLARAGQFEAAIPLFRTVTDACPDYAEAQVNLGNCLLIMGQQSGQNSELLTDACTHFERAIEIEPTHFRAWLNLGKAEKMRQRLGEAEKALNRALELDPDAPQAQVWLANTLIEVGKTGKSEALLKEALVTSPDFADARWVLAELYLQQGQAQESTDMLDEAIRHFEVLREQLPEHLPLFMRLGTALRLRGRREEAAECFRTVIKLNPDHAEAHYRLGGILSGLGNLAEAVEEFDRTIAVQPNHAEVYPSKAIVLEKMNELDAARDTIQKGLEIAPDNPRLRLSLAKLEVRAGKRQEALEQYKQLADDTRLELRERGFVLNEMGKIYDKLGDYDTAYEYFCKAQYTLSQTFEAMRQDPAIISRNYEICKEWYTPEWMTGWEKYTPDDNRLTPIFLIGFPRSGTTLMEQILSAHPLVEATQEKPLLADIIANLSSILGRQVAYPEVMGTLTDAEIGKLRAFYFAKRDALFDDPQIAQKYIVDKMPLNINHIGLIQRLFPDAKILMMLRDPRDACLSAFIQSFQPNSAMANFYTLENTTRFYHLVMGTWLYFDASVSVDRKAVRYEDMVSNLESVAHEVFDFLSISWDDAVMAYHTQNRHVTTPSYEGVMKPIYASSMQRWKHYAPYFVPYRQWLDPYVDAFSYEPMADDLNAPEREIPLPVQQAQDEAVSTLYNRAEAMLEQGNPMEAMTMLQQVLAQRLHYTKAHRLLAETALKHGQETQNRALLNLAVHHFREVVDAKPKEVSSWMSLGVACRLCEQFEAAIDCFHHVLELDSDNATAHYRLALSLGAQRQYPEALEHYDEALRLKPDYLDVYLSKALVQEMMNHLDDAQATIQAGLKIAPDNARLLLPLAKLERRAGNLESAAAHYDVVLASDSLNEMERCLAMNERARIFDKQQRYPEAWDAFEVAQEAMANLPIARQHDGVALKESYRRWAEWAQSDDAFHWPDCSLPDEGEPPLFVVGFPRSGTTLMEQMLSAHPQLSGTQEEPFLELLLKELPGAYPRVLSSLSEEEITELRQRYREMLQSSGQEQGIRKVDKNPMNITLLPLIARLFPTAKVVVMLRDPRDACLSAFMQAFHPNPAMVNFYRMADTVNFYDAVMENWETCRDRLPLAMKVVRYEALVADTEHWMREVLEFYDIPWNDAVMEYYRADKNRHVFTPSYEGVMQPVYQGSVGRWKAYAGPMAPYIETLQPWLERLNYEEEG